MQIAPPQQFVKLLNRIYSDYASVIIISGLWKTGKTDFALRIAETLLDMGLVKYVASNAKTEREDIKHVQSLTMLKFWSKSNRGSKLFIYDEVIESSPKRRAMSELNVEWVKFIPQASKLDLHILALLQAESLGDSIFLNHVFCRGMWKKLGLKTAVFNSTHFKIEDYKLTGIPRTTIGFNPKAIATFSVSDVNADFSMLPDTLKIATLYGSGLSYSGIQLRLGIQHREKVRREIQKACKILVTLSHNNSEGERVNKLCDSVIQA